MSQQGRPRALADKQTRRIVCAMIASGAGVDLAARQAGCSPWTIRREAQRDELFAQQLREAQNAAEIAPLQTLRGAAQTNWRAAAWILERMSPERYAPRKPFEITRGERERLFDEIALVICEECTDPEVKARVLERMEYFQKDALGVERIDRQGSPPRDPAEDAEPDEFC